ncbi:PorV/PorQ family protein [candidate division KSB1 bacterium]
MLSCCDKHSSKILIFALIIAMLPVCALQPCFAQHPGLTFLRIQGDAHGAALGGAFTASGTGLSAVEWNPAGAVLGSGHEVALGHIRGFEDTDSEYFAFLWKRSEKRILALSLFSNNIEGIEFRTRPTEKPEGIISAHDFYTGLTYSMRYGPHMQFGSTFRYLYQKIYSSSASGFSADFGARFAPEDSRYAFAIVLKNIGSMRALRYESPTMPALLRVGASYCRLIDSGSSHLFEISGEYESLFEGDDHMYFGIDYGYNRTYHFRSGYITGFEEGRMSTGAGLSINRYTFDYAYLPDITAFGNQHIMTFRLHF